MSQVTVSISGRKYQIACDDGQEAHLTRLAKYVDQRVGELTAAVGQVGDARLLVMASLLIADELSDAYARLEGVGADKGTGKDTGVDKRNADAEVKKRIDDLLGASLDSLAKRVEGIADRVKQA